MIDIEHTTIKKVGKDTLEVSFDIYGADGDCLAIFKQNENDVYVFDHYCDGVDRPVRFLQWLEQTYGKSLRQRFYEYFIRRNASNSITIKSLQQGLNVSRDEAKHILQTGVIEQVIQQYFSYWRLTNHARACLARMEAKENDRAQELVSEKEQQPKDVDRLLQEELINISPDRLQKGGRKNYAEGSISKHTKK